MGKKPESFLERGLSRHLVRWTSHLPIGLVCSDVRRAAPLSLSDEAERTLRRISEIYLRRGFEGLRVGDLGVPASPAWVLEHIDLETDTQCWAAAGFTVKTGRGVWYVEVSNGGSRPQICAIRQVSEEQAARPDWRASEAPLPRIERGGKIWSSLTKLQEASWWAMRSLKSADCHGAWRACKELQDCSRGECRSLYEATLWDGKEDWHTWGSRALKDLLVACAVRAHKVPARMLHFTHGSISTYFRHGRTVGDLECLVEDLRAGRVDLLSCPDLVLDVIDFRGKLFSLNNRRLWAIQQYELTRPDDDVVCVCVRLLPWSERSTFWRFHAAFDNDLDGGAVLCRTSQRRAPFKGVILTTLTCAVLPTGASKAAELVRERNANPPRDSRVRALLLGRESFVDWRAAKERVKEIMHHWIRGDVLWSQTAEFELLLDVFRHHPDALDRQLDAVTAITVGSSEKFPESPSFWIWKGVSPGKWASMVPGECISAVKCWKRLDLEEKRLRGSGGASSVRSAGLGPLVVDLWEGYRRQPRQ
mmetsp:Transcript_24355/g.69192  ORF Transcript_24355/g.69192 Transcript_24355/m.69192 type:complete len:533 (+) Transcript_24355:118-1716(+)